MQHLRAGDESFPLASMISRVRFLERRACRSFSGTRSILRWPATTVAASGPPKAVRVQAEACSHDVIAFGFWPGDANRPAPTLHLHGARTAGAAAGGGPRVASLGSRATSGASATTSWAQQAIRVRGYFCSWRAAIAPASAARNGRREHVRPAIAVVIAEGLLCAAFGGIVSVVPAGVHRATIVAKSSA